MRRDNRAIDRKNRTKRTRHRRLLREIRERRVLALAEMRDVRLARIEVSQSRQLETETKFLALSPERQALRFARLQERLLVIEATQAKIVARFGPFHVPMVSRPPSSLQAALNGFARHSLASPKASRTRMMF